QNRSKPREHRNPNLQSDNPIEAVFPRSCRHSPEQDHRRARKTRSNGEDDTGPSPSRHRRAVKRRKKKPS
ncbi:predicted protein, partial [Arabidopsis lyrata subsp. lyrata]